MCPNRTERWSSGRLTSTHSSGSLCVTGGVEHESDGAALCIHFERQFLVLRVGNELAVTCREEGEDSGSRAVYEEVIASSADAESLRRLDEVLPYIAIRTTPPVHVRVNAVILLAGRNDAQRVFSPPPACEAAGRQPRGASPG